MDILNISHVSKSFGSHEVIRDLSFTVPEHTVFGFIGPNGAGKTTTMKMVLGLLKADSGEIFVNGEKVTFGQNKTNAFIGYLPDVPEFYGFMTPMEYLCMCGRITGMSGREILERAGQILKQVGLEEYSQGSTKRIRGFSRGMKQRLGIAQALLNRPKLLICDEPTSALDPAGRKEILDILGSVREHTTVVFSTHILSDVERICDHAAFLYEGRLALDGSLEELRAARRGGSVEIEFARAEDARRFFQYNRDDKEGRFPYRLLTKSGKETAYHSLGEREQNSLHEFRFLFTNQSEKDMIDMMAFLAGKGIAVQRLERLEPALEDLFLEVVGR